MMKTNKFFALVCAASITAGLMGCGAAAASASADTTTEAATDAASATEAPVADTADIAAEEKEEAGTDLEGTITMAGSTSMEKMANAIAESFMLKYPGVTVTAEFTGSSAGIEAVTAGSVDIGNSSRALKEGEKTAGAVEHIVAIDGIAVAVDPANTVTDLTKE